MDPDFVFSWKAIGLDQVVNSPEAQKTGRGIQRAVGMMLLVVAFLGSCMLCGGFFAGGH